MSVIADANIWCYKLYTYTECAMRYIVLQYIMSAYKWKYFALYKYTNNKKKKTLYKMYSFE